MPFEVDLNALVTPALSLEYHTVPWDSRLLARPVAQIRSIKVSNSVGAIAAFSRYVDWKSEHNIAFSTAKIDHNLVEETLLVQRFGYRFIELNYRPEIALRDSQRPGSRNFEFVEAESADRQELCEIASQVFRNTRFHLDSALGRELGDQRYESWMQNAFDLPHQQVIKCVWGDSILAFFVQEYPTANHVFWSLVGLAPGHQGKGLGKEIWLAAMQWLRTRDIARISTSISSLNTPALNLYARLGFRFSEPQVTFHWHRTTRSG